MKEAIRMSDKKIIIDADQFAAAIIAGNPKQTNEDNKVYIKRQLTLYLESVLLATEITPKIAVITPTVEKAAARPITYLK